MAELTYDLFSSRAHSDSGTGRADVTVGSCVSTRRLADSEEARQDKSDTVGHQADGRGSTSCRPRRCHRQWRLHLVRVAVRCHCSSSPGVGPDYDDRRFARLEGCLVVRTLRMGHDTVHLPRFVLLLRFKQSLRLAHLLQRHHG